MTMVSSTFVPGQWVVHRQYGIGKIAGIEEKQISGEQSSYCRLDTSDGTIWVPLTSLDTDRFRPVASQTDLQEAIEILSRPARQMAARFDERKQRIEEVKAEHRLTETARLIRDLWVRQTNKSLTIAEQRALRHLTSCLVREWSVGLSISWEAAEQDMYRLLRQSQLQ